MSFRAIMTDEVFCMEKRVLIEWMTAGTVSIPKLLLLHYAELGLKEAELIMLIQVHSFIDEGSPFPTPKQLAERMTYSADECADLLNGLLKRGFLSLKQYEDERGLVNECYSLERLWERLAYLLIDEEEKEKQQSLANLEQSLYSIFEQEFSRPLSPMECEMLSMWLDDDQFPAELVKAALRESVVSGKLNFRYIDRILFEWKKNGVRSVDQAKVYGEKFRQYQHQQRQERVPRENATKIPSFNWLNQ